MNRVLLLTLVSVTLLWVRSLVNSGLIHSNQWIVASGRRDGRRPGRERDRAAARITSDEAPTASRPGTTHGRWASGPTAGRRCSAPASRRPGRTATPRPRAGPDRRPGYRTRLRRGRTRARRRRLRPRPPAITRPGAPIRRLSLRQSCGHVDRPSTPLATSPPPPRYGNLIHRLPPRRHGAADGSERIRDVAGGGAVGQVGPGVVRTFSAGAQRPVRVFRSAGRDPRCP